MATVLDPSLLEVQRAAQESRVFLSELGAIPFLERLSTELADREDGARPDECRCRPITESEVAAS